MQLAVRARDIFTTLKLNPNPSLHCPAVQLCECAPGTSSLSCWARSWAAPR